MMTQLREIKVLFLGAANLGKSHLRHRLSRLEVPTHYRPTLGTEVSPVRLVGNGTVAKQSLKTGVKIEKGKLITRKLS